MNTTARLLGILLILLGASVATNWLDQSIFINIGSSPMQFTTAIWFILLGISLVTLQNIPIISQAVGVTLMIWTAMLIIGAYGFGYNLHHSVMYDNLPAVNTCASFFSIGLVLAVKRITNNLFVMNFLLANCYFIISLGLVAIIGYILKIPTAYGWGGISHMAILSAIAILLVGLFLSYRLLVRIPDDERVIYFPVNSFLFIGIFSGILIQAVYQFENNKVHSIMNDQLGSYIPYYLIFIAIVFAILFSVTMLYLQLLIINNKKMYLIESQFKENINKNLQLIMDSSHLSIISTDLNGVITHFNKAAEKMLEYSSSEMIGLKTPEVFHDKEEVISKAVELSKKFDRDIQPGFDVFISELDQTVAVENEWTYISKHGRRTPVLLSVTAMRDQSGRPYGYLGIALDISERKAIEKLKNEFISMVSHELRTPLTSIHGSIVLLLEQVTGKQSTESHELLTIALNNTERLIRLINDILDVEKIESGQMGFKYDNTLVNDLIEEAVAVNQSYAHKFNVNLNYHLPHEQSVKIHVDHDRTIQVLTNLISNAIKFSQAGDTVSVDVNIENHQVVISVIDHGKGISEDFKRHIFQKFAQEDSSSIRKQQGTGLGLSICKLMTEAMGGSIDYESTAGSGTTFYLRFPIAE